VTRPDTHMFMFKRRPSDRRRKPEPNASFSPCTRPEAGLPPFGNITGLELMALLMSR
jgi:hypothetical protein